MKTSRDLKKAVYVGVINFTDPPVGSTNCVFVLIQWRDQFHFELIQWRGFEV